MARSLPRELRPRGPRRARADGRRMCRTVIEGGTARMPLRRDAARGENSSGVVMAWRAALAGRRGRPEWPSRRQAEEAGQTPDRQDHSQIDHELQIAGLVSIA